MKKLFLVTSCINVDNRYPLTYSDRRSFFDASERLRQTIFTVNSIISRTPDADIWLIDTSENWPEYAVFFQGYPQVKFLPFRQEFPDVYEQVTQHPNKSLCECLLLSSVMLKMYREMAAFDYVFKLTARYFINDSFDLSVLENTPDKIFYKRPLGYEWDHGWNYDIVDRRAEQGNNLLYQYSTVLHAWGRRYQLYYRDQFTAMAAMLSQPSMSHFNTESLNYFFTRPYADDIIETDWQITGWDGTNGNFLRY